MILFDRVSLTEQIHLEKEFKEQYVTTFLANWAAARYDHACMHDEHERLYDPPLEDAEHLSGKAWDKVKERCTAALERKGLSV